MISFTWYSVFIALRSLKTEWVTKPKRSLKNSWILHLLTCINPVFGFSFADIVDPKFYLYILVTGEFLSPP